MEECRLYDHGNGSSPWVRRTLGGMEAIYLLMRFISVGTENTGLKYSRSKKSPVHLRGYGEHKTTWLDKVWTTGSSPWVRRTQVPGLSLNIRERFISVGTENTINSQALSRWRAVHLRGYGEHIKKVTSLLSTDGSSPWVRRTL